MAKLSQAEKEKRKPKFLINLFKGRRAKAKEAASKKGMAESAMKSTVAKAEKKYAKESMFPKAREDARKNIAKPRSFKEAFDAASKAGKSKFLHKGKGYLTTKGKREDRFDPTKIKAVANLDQRRMKKRVMNMRKRKKEGKSYSAKNLAELTAKLEKQNIL
tara:strand:+ start:60 stop:542 length:483 start_codon:yes stop_codon:yes gene_type:complete